MPANARKFKIPDGNGGYIPYTIHDIENRRTRRNITNDLANLPAAIAAQDLGKYGYAIGDWFTGASGYSYILADMDTFYGGYDSYAVLATHHIGIVVDTDQNVQWNTSNDTSSGYVGSNLHTYLTGTVLNNIKSDIAALFGDWSSHLLKHQKLLSTGTDAWSWSADQYIAALTSVQIHGSPVCDMNWYHTGEGNKPLEVFQKFFYPEILGNQNNWLRSIASASCPCLAYSGGRAAGDGGASASLGAVGLILFK